jgi:hypothetical protein
LTKASRDTGCKNGIKLVDTGCHNGIKLAVILLETIE